MAVKKPEPKHVLIDFTYNEKLILPQQAAAKLIALLEEGECFESDWNHETAKIKPDFGFTMSPIPNEEILGIKKAQLAGITYKEYLELQKEKTDGNDQGSETS